MAKVIAIKPTKCTNQAKGLTKLLQIGDAFAIKQFASIGSNWLVVLGLDDSGNQLSWLRLTNWLVPKADVRFAIGNKAIQLIKQYEGLELKAYKDAVGIWTIGYGHTGSEVIAGYTINSMQAELLLKADLAKFEQGVAELVKVPITSGQFEALVSFSYNIGLGALADSTLLILLNAHRYADASAQLVKWVHGNGREILPGLIARRNAELQLWQKG